MLRKPRTERAMSQSTGIEWTDATWNPSTGCSKVSSGCKYCYAETLAFRLERMGNLRYQNGFAFTKHVDKIEDPLGWKSPRKVFVNSMSDLFHEDSDIEFVAKVFDVMQRTPRHQYQVLTKRPRLMAEWLIALMKEGRYSPAPHIWLGTSVEDAQVLDRVRALQDVPSEVRFLSCEPLLGPLTGLSLEGISWVIVGGESGQHLWREKTRRRRALVDVEQGVWRPSEPRVPWVRAIRDQCVQDNVAFFFKQWGGNTPKAAGRLLDGREWSEYPRLRSSSSDSCASA